MSTRSFLGVLGVGLSIGLAATRGVRAEDGATVGRVKITTIRQGSTSQWDVVSEALGERYSPRPERQFSDRRLISLRPQWNNPKRFDATIYDYTSESAYELVLDAFGNEISRRETAEQPARAAGELADAYAIVAQNQSYARALAKGELQVYEAMPPITVDALGRRLINVGIMNRPEAGKALAQNEIVSVSIPTGEIIHYATGAPTTSRAGLFACGPGTSGCSYATGPCATYQIVWPSVQPVWKLNVRHPSCTSSVQGDGTGLEITDVYYKGRLILKRGEVPVLNVLYAGNTCGPYRDWLTSEDCFQATGTDVPGAGSGIRVASAPPSTLCESQSDAGNFKGVAIYDQGDALWLMTETNAGWYRYVMEWRFHLDGTIEPIFGFGATSNNCTCNLHFHQAYWRLEWAIDATSDGTTDDPATGINTIERHRSSGSPDDFDPVPTEGSFIRPAVGGTADTWRIRNPLTGNGYVIQPGSLDGSAAGDAYGKWDLTALALNPNQIDDPNSDTSIQVAPWVNGESLGAGKRLVTWYHASFTHDDPGGGGEACELVGPKLVPLVPCAGSINIDRSVYACGGSVAVTMSDSDLTGQGSAVVTLSSGSETTPEPLTLAENPPGTGQFTGAILTTLAPAVSGDGMISVTNGDTIHARYVDASACGVPNVTVEKTAAIDCVAPVITNVHATSVTGNSATLAWDTNEPASSGVTYGAFPPPPATTPPVLSALTTNHSVPVAGLSSCTQYVYSVASTDGAGNASSDTNAGSYYTFTTGVNVQPTYTYAGPPVAIPDNSPTGAFASIVVPDAKTVTDLDVTIGSLTHTYDGDLTIHLIGPDATDVILSNHNGGGGDGFLGTILDDSAAASLATGTAPFTGSFRPDTSLSAFNGKIAAGTWKLFVVDGAAADVGTIDSFSLTFTYPAQPCGAHATYDSHAFVGDTCSTGGSGNANGIWEAGEQVQFGVRVDSDGSTNLTGVSATVTSSTPGVTMLNGTASYPNIAAGTSADSNAPGFTANLPTTLACGSTVAFQLTVTSNEGSWVSTFTQFVGQVLPGGGTALNEAFTGGIPVSWTIVDGGSGGGAAATWNTANPGGRTIAAPLAAPVAIVDSDNGGSSATQDEQLITPVINLATAASATLEFDQYFHWYNLGLDEIADVDVRSSLTGGVWVNVLHQQGADSSDPDHKTINLTAQTAGATDAQVRFHYYQAQYEWWWQVDNVKVTTTAAGGCNQVVCAAPPAVVKPVPDGSFGTAMTGSRANPAGTAINVSWDVATCASTGYHILYGSLAGLPGYAIGGSVCAIGTSGSYAWAGVPSGNLWFLSVADDGTTTEGSWGTAQPPAERNGGTASGVCGFTTRDNAGTCP